MKWQALVLSFMVSGCVTPPDWLISMSTPNLEPTYEQTANSRLIAANYEAADYLLKQSGSSLDPHKPILAATFVGIDDLNRSSRLGRLLSEHFASRFTHQGLSVIEMKMRSNIFVQRTEGELLLSRELQDISQSHSAQAVIVGSYAQSKDYVYVTAKLVRSVDNVVMAAHDYVLPLDTNIGSMLSR